MKTMLIAAFFALTLNSAFAAEKIKKEASPAQQAQRQKMKACNAEAKEKALKGDERKSFMKVCLKKDKK